MNAIRHTILVLENKAEAAGLVLCVATAFSDAVVKSCLSKCRTTVSYPLTPNSPDPYSTLSSEQQPEPIHKDLMILSCSSTPLQNKDFISPHTPTHLYCVEDQWSYDFATYIPHSKVERLRRQRNPHLQSFGSERLSDADTGKLLDRKAVTVVPEQHFPLGKRHTARLCTTAGRNRFVPNSLIPSQTSRTRHIISHLAPFLSNHA